MIGIIYKIVCNVNPNIIYIGSTTKTLQKRWVGHIYDYKRKKNVSVSIYEYFDKYDIKNFNIVLIKEYVVIDKYHLSVYEQLWINKYKKICVNKINPFKIKFLSNKVRGKKYYEEHKEELKEKITCECGSIIRTDYIHKHIKRKKHIDYISSKK
jgi:hypothetical protein